MWNRVAALSVVLFALIIANAKAHVSDPKKILTVGDSWAEYSGNAFGDYCEGAIQINKGIGGSTAVGWAGGGQFHGRDTNFANALQAAGPMNANDIIYLSVGGNDWMGTTPPCMGQHSVAGRALIQTQVQNAVTALKDALTATNCGTSCPQIWMFGYAMIADTSNADGCIAQGAPGALSPLKVAIREVARTTEGVNYKDITTLCGGTANSLSSGAPCFGMRYYNQPGQPVDNIHMNKRGYCLAVTQPDIQTAWGCTAKTYDCSTEDKDLTQASRKAAKCVQYPCSAAPAAGTCDDDDAGLKATAEAAGTPVENCAGASGYCNHETYGATVKSLCPVTCSCAAPTCCAESLMLAQEDTVVPESAL